MQLLHMNGELISSYFGGLLLGEHSSNMTPTFKNQRISKLLSSDVGSSQPSYGVKFSNGINSISMFIMGSLGCI